MKIIPNLLTFSRIVLAPVFLFLFLSGNPYWAAFGVFIFALAATTDFFDGYLARELNARSAFGNFMDPLADKVLTFSGFFAICYLRPDLFPWFVFAAIVGRDILITVMRLIARKKGHPLRTSNNAKLKTAVQMIFLYLALFTSLFYMFTFSNGFVEKWLFGSGLMSWLFYGVMLFTIYTAVEYFFDNKTLFFSDKTAIN